MKKKALIIGCGNIGALYDIDEENISNHAKGLIHSGQFDLSFSDQNIDSAEHAASKYGGKVVNDLNSATLNSFSWISICAPTNTHYRYLKQVEGLEPKIVLCEKPISYASEEIVEIENMFENSPHSIFINYFRRFLPSYIKLKVQYSNLLAFSNLRECRIEYCRGFLNSASHGFDLLEFLFDRPVNLEGVEISATEFDVFQEDPTLSAPIIQR